MRLTWLQMLLIVAACAAVGLIGGGLIGLVAGIYLPEIVVNITPWQQVEPVRFATFWGALVGMVLVGGLGLISVILHQILEWLHARST